MVDCALSAPLDKHCALSILPLPDDGYAGDDGDGDDNGDGDGDGDGDKYKHK